MPKDEHGRWRLYHDFNDPDVMGDRVELSLIELSVAEDSMLRVGDPVVIWDAGPPLMELEGTLERDGDVWYLRPLREERPDHR